jgi:hypothetical protein
VPGHCANLMWTGSSHEHCEGSRLVWINTFQMLCCAYKPLGASTIWIQRELGSDERKTSARVVGSLCSNWEWPFSSTPSCRPKSAWRPLKTCIMKLARSAYRLGCKVSYMVDLPSATGD